MRIKKALASVVFVACVAASPNAAQAFDITGGPTWEARVGPGLSFSLGLNGCTREYCDHMWDTTVSIGTTVGFYWRIIPNLVVFGDFHFGHIPVHARYGVYFHNLDVHDDNAFVFQATAGAEFHLPLTGWVAPFAGLGMGFAYLGFWGDLDNRLNSREGFHHYLGGFDFQLRFGADFYPFSRVPNLSLGPVLYVGLPAWVKACWEEEWRDYRQCEHPEDLPQTWRIRGGESPFIVYFGVGMRYGF